MNDLTPSENSVRITNVGLRFDRELSFEEWSNLGQRLGKAARISMLLVGDWLNYGQDRWNGGNRFERMAEEQRAKYEEAMQLTGLELGSLQAASQVARKISLEDRSENLTFSHHRLLSRIKDDDVRREWIQKTVDGNFSTRRLRMSLNAGRFVSEKELATPVQKGRKTHLFWITRLTQWWASSKATSEYQEMTREQLEAVLLDFEPVFGIIDEIRDKAEQAQAYLET